MKTISESRAGRTFAKQAARTGICLTLACMTPLTAHAQSSTQTLPPAEKQTEATQKFGLLNLAGYAGLTIFQAINNWANNRIGGAAMPAQAGAAQPSTAVSLAAAFVNQIAPQLQGSLATMAQGSQSAWIPSPQPASYNLQPGQQIPFTQAPHFSPAPLILGQPDVPFATQQAAFDPNKPWDGRANYQGVTVSAMMLDSQNRVTETRSLVAAFRTGERFKLRLVSTFDAIVSLDALRAQPGTVSPEGVFSHPPSWAGQLYPARADQVVRIKAGEVAMLPLGASEYFTFEGKTGLELLSLNVRHPQATNQELNRQPVYRQDMPEATAYSQLAQNGAYLGLSQILVLRHGN
ncbi:hypothetical protein [Noviherbaspirillum sedimenti]|uniref:DUF4384 domain-containing protein n=1 Tax=Noviherbaspirillum sedimenti TaxID=2320865 RepID=A0A3A3GE20_9BURK|nr:hypothetical protein [Noviherbaspirillum sedimenti]RJG00476.1 hypothetical protein D3878_01850 [Noviherbaspirillum sedimenti]